MEVKTETKKAEDEKKVYRMRFDMPQAELRAVFDFFKKALNKTVLFYVSEDGVRIAAYDFAKIAVGVVYINKGCMKNYNVSNNHTFALDLDSLKGSLILLKDRQAMLSFIQNEDEITVTSGDGFTKTVSVSDDLVEVRVPEIKYESGGVVDSHDFYAAVNMAADMNDLIKLTGDGSNLVVSAYRDDKKKLAIEAPLKLKGGKFNGEMTTMPSDYLKNATASLKNFELMVRMKKAGVDKMVQPVKINFKKAVLNGELKGYIMIAPMREQ